MATLASYIGQGGYGSATQTQGLARVPARRIQYDAPTLPQQQGRTGLQNLQGGLPPSYGSLTDYQGYGGTLANWQGGIPPGGPHGTQGPKGKPWKPFVFPSEPPAGTYDPNLDANLNTAARKLGDYTRDYERDYGAFSVDPKTGKVKATAGGRSFDNFQLAKYMLGRSYSQLANSQTEGARTGGMGYGEANQGYLAAAQGKRYINQSLAQGQADLNYKRTTEDASTALARAMREHAHFVTDTKKSEFYQAIQNGWNPTGRPPTERHVLGAAYRRVGKNRYELPSGRYLNAGQLRHFLLKQPKLAKVGSPTALGKALHDLNLPSNVIRNIYQRRVRHLPIPTSTTTGAGI